MKKTYARIILLLIAVSLEVIIIFFFYYYSISSPEKCLTIAVTIANSEVSPNRSGFKSWKEGVVTALTPRIDRNCARLLAGDEGEISRVNCQLTHWNNAVSDEDILEKTRNCSWVQSYLTDNLYTIELERSFPIAFTYVVYNSPQQILRLFRVHYRQHNVYCIHTDKKASHTFSGIFQNIATCLDNVIIPKTLIDVVWGTESIMDAQMACLTELVLYREKQEEDKKWKYVINLCGKELPLTTTHTIIEHLTKLNGSSSMKTSRMEEMDVKRLKGKVIPFGLPGYRSATYMALSYKFANFLLTNQTSVELFHFFRGCRHPEEHYYATVYMIPGVPGGYNPNLSKAYFSVNKSFWMFDKEAECGGKIVHDVCIVSVADLKRILETSGDGEHSLFHNKYFMKMDHVVMDCMEERIVARNKLEFQLDSK